MGTFANPFRPGAGHKPPYLAGRGKEFREFERLLAQRIILENMVLTGLRGVGKTVLLDCLKPRAQQAGWLWVGADLSESAALNEENMAIRLLADLSVITSNLALATERRPGLGFTAQDGIRETRLDYRTLSSLYINPPGLAHDKLKGTLEFVWNSMTQKAPEGVSGIVFAYDEAQNLADHSEKEQYPLSLLLDVFQSLQKKGIPFMLLLAGLPTLFPKLVDARTFAERMFRVVFLDKLDREESRAAIVKPMEAKACPVRMDSSTIELIIDLSGGYPYFIQFICREMYDSLLFGPDGTAFAPVDAILAKLDTDFFAGRWARVSDRQRVLLYVVSRLDHTEEEFSLAEIVTLSGQILKKPFSSSNAGQMLSSLVRAGLIYRNSHGKYSFAIPLLSQFIKRQPAEQFLRASV